MARRTLGPLGGPFEIDRGSAQANGLAALWTLGLAERNHAGLAYPLTLVSAPPFASHPVFGAGLEMDGSADWCTASSAALSLNVGTVVMWCRPDFASSASGNRQFFDSDAARHAFFQGLSGGVTPIIQMYNDGRFTDFLVSWAAGSTLHLAFAYNKTGNYQQVYQNGVAATPRAAAGGTWGSTALGANIYIGARFAAARIPFDGLIGEVRIYNRVLSAAEVWQLWDPATRWQIYRPAARVWTVYDPTAPAVTRARMIGGGGTRLWRAGAG